jgi:hypothetical protein
LEAKEELESARSEENLFLDLYMDEEDEVQTKAKLLTQDEGRWSKSKGGEVREIKSN